MADDHKEEDDDYQDESLTDAVEAGDELRILLAAQRYVANELEGHRCPKCLSSQLRTGEQSSLLVQLRNLTKEIRLLRGQSSGGGQKSKTQKGVRDDLASLRARRAAVGESVPDDAGAAVLGTKNAPRRQGNRKPRNGGY